MNLIISLILCVGEKRILCIVISRFTIITNYLTGRDVISNNNIYSDVNTQDITYINV